jgi:hypothetical protein
MCEETFPDGWGCEWESRSLLVGGIYYHRLLVSRFVVGDCYYELLTDWRCAMYYSHLVVRHHYPMLQYKCKKGNPRFKMSAALGLTFSMTLKNRIVMLFSDAYSTATGPAEV